LKEATDVVVNMESNEMLVLAKQKIYRIELREPKKEIKE
jgi:hypothetical protein